MSNSDKIFTVIGARPQFVKAAALNRAIQNYNMTHPDKQLKSCWIHTGQHYDNNMSQVFFDELDIPKPDYHLGISSGSHGVMTGTMLASIEKILVKEEPKLVIVFGDTNSTLAGALAAVKLHIPVVHIEAGLRSFNKKMPEEINRITTDHCSQALLTPSESSKQQLIKEGISNTSIYNVGDIMYDAVLYYKEKAKNTSSILERLNLKKKKYALATIHRQENTDNSETLSAIFHGLIKIASQTPIVLPLHPRTKEALIRAKLLEEVQKHLKIIDPIGYLDMIALLSNSSTLLTDSGGMQKESFYLKVPCLTLRPETEWIELLIGQINQLVNINSHSILKAFQSIQNTNIEWPKSPYGDGNTGDKIIPILRHTIEAGYQ